jgi:hypothetical protein
VGGPAAGVASLIASAAPSHVGATEGSPAALGQRKTSTSNAARRSWSTRCRPGSVSTTGASMGVGMKRIRSVMAQLSRAHPANSDLVVDCLNLWAARAVTLRPSWSPATAWTTVLKTLLEDNDGQHH